jgi:hypothetical protein
MCRVTSWSLLGPGVEVGLAFNIMNGISMFLFQLLGSFYYYF